MIQLTPNAAKHIERLIADQELPKGSGVRFAVKGGGCSGFEYHVEMAGPSRFELPRKADKIFISHGIRVVVDDKSLLFLTGTTVDWKTHNLGHSFVFENPAATAQCGCGLSFSV